MRKINIFIKCIIGLSVLCLGGIGIAGNIKNNTEKKWPIKRPSKQIKESIKKVLPQQKKEIISEKVEAYLDSMSIEEKIGQLFIIALDADKEGNGVTILDINMKEKLQRTHVGGVILFKNNIIDSVQTKSLIEALQASSQVPLFICVDEEGGIVSRVGSNPNINDAPFMAAEDIGKTKDVKVAYNEASRMGKLLKELGFNMNLAPCGDIYNNPINTIIGSRSFGATKEEVTSMTVAFAKGLMDEGILPVVKHYPGHGNTMEDSHNGLAYVYKNLEELEAEELVPFKESVKADIGGLMKGHLLANCIDEVWPVSLSEKWNDYINKEMNTEEVLLITDALNMGAIVNNYGEEEVVLRSFLAGNDLQLMPINIERAEETLYKAYQTGLITQEQIDYAVRKILTKKVEQNILLIS